MPAAQPTLPGIPTPAAPEAPKATKLDLQGIKTVRKVGEHAADGLFHGYVPARTLSWLYGQVELLNKRLLVPHIGHAAPLIALSVERTRSTQLGHYKIGRDGLGLRWRIVLNVLHLDRSRSSVVRTLLHEMLHAVQHEHGTPPPRSNANYHNAEFLGWAEKLGIPSDAQGHDLGTKKGGLFEQYCKDLGLGTGGEDEKKPLVEKKGEDGRKVAKPRPGGSKLKKWSCGCTNVRVAVSTFDATCNNCGRDFKLCE